MKRYLIPLLVLCFIVFGITTGTSYAESQATQSTNITATEEASQSFKRSIITNIESTNKPLSLESSNVSHNEQATPSSETTTHPSVETSTTQNTTSEKHNNSSQGSAFSQEKLHLNLLQMMIIHLHKKKHRQNPLQMKIIHRNSMVRR